MKKRLSPQEKKQLAYERDHYVLGESRHGFRKKWPKKKQMANQRQRHLAARALRRLESLGGAESPETSTTEVTAEQLRKIDPREKLFKWRVQSLKEYVETRQTNRDSRAEHHLRERELIEGRCKAVILALEQNPDSLRVRDFIRQVQMGGGWGWDFSLFLRWHPGWRPRMEKAWSDLIRAAQKAERKRQNKQAEKQRAKELRKAVQRQTKTR